ncbi:DegT/DnrJ/EryC1/StrS family aminotransferase [Lysinibacillus sp. KU-BSD001]|uniref:DegT/DnrJ/EryC1/StrS family aminotransferase n=1 Tax=Lysinibacillus sp. KU-BSD001 TaxID=3141328 RepID=UPI0036E8C715
MYVNKQFGRNPVPHNRPTLGSLEEQMAMSVIQSGWVAQGRAVENFENEFCDFLGVPRGSAIAVSSGTAALYLALIALDAPTKNVAYPVYSCSALRNAIALAKGIPVVIDCQHDCPNMDIAAIGSETNIAIIPHMFGLPQDLSSLAGKKYVIEDCAQALGARVNGIPVGLQGDIGIFSFYATKLMTTGGQGGMIVCKDASIIEKLKDYRLHDQRFDTKLRFNFQMTDLQAAVGSAQLQQFSQFLQRRQEIYEQYKAARLPLLGAGPGLEPVHFRAILQTAKQQEIIKALAKHDITAVVPIREVEILEPKAQYPNALKWTQNTVSLPIYPLLQDEDVQRIIQVVQQII